MKSELEIEEEEEDQNEEEQFEFPPLPTTVITPSFFVQRIRNDLNELMHHNLNDEHSQLAVDYNLNVYKYFAKLYFTLTPLQGQFTGYTYNFYLLFSESFPIHPMHIFVHLPLYHPNVNQLSGQMFMKLLSVQNVQYQQWRPSYTIYTILLRLKQLFIDIDCSYIPNTPANKECAEIYLYKSNDFRQNFLQIMSKQYEELQNDMNIEEEHMQPQKQPLSPLASYKNDDCNSNTFEHNNKQEHELEDTQQKLAAMTLDFTISNKKRKHPRSEDITSTYCKAIKR